MKIFLSSLVMALALSAGAGGKQACPAGQSCPDQKKAACCLKAGDQAKANCCGKSLAGKKGVQSPKAKTLASK